MKRLLGAEVELCRVREKPQLGGNRHMNVMLLKMMESSIVLDKWQACGGTDKRIPARRITVVACAQHKGALLFARTQCTHGCTKSILLTDARKA